MINKVFENQNLLKLLFSFAILLIFLDSYQVLNTPLSWVGNLLLTLICLIIFRKENMKFNLLYFVIVFVTLLPTIFSLFTMTYNSVNLNYLGIRLFSYLGFILVFFVIINFGYKEAIVESLKIIFWIYSKFCWCSRNVTSISIGIIFYLYYVTFCKGSQNIDSIVCCAKGIVCP